MYFFTTEENVVSGILMTGKSLIRFRKNPGIVNASGSVRSSFAAPTKSRRSARKTMPRSSTWQNGAKSMGEYKSFKFGRETKKHDEMDHPSEEAIRRFRSPAYGAVRMIRHQAEQIRKEGG